MSSVKHENLLADIKKSISMSDKNYKVLYEKLINNFAEFVQLLPTKQQGRLGSLLEEGLIRGLFLLKTQDLASESINGLEIYMLFSVALLFDVAKVIEERYVILSKKNGGFIERWLPSCIGSMLEQGKYYRVRLGGGYSPLLCRRITPLLASKLLSERGFKLISKDPKIFYAWWALLSGEETENAAYRRILNKAHEQLHDFTDRDEYSLPIEVEPIESELQIGDDFMEWLEKYVETDVTNDENIEVLGDGDHIFIDEKVFQQFAEEREITNWKYVVEEFEELGYTDASEQDKALVEEIKQEGNEELFSAQQAVKTDKAAKVGRTSETSRDIKNGVVISDVATAQLMSYMSQPAAEVSMSHSFTMF
jgi:hypothetical protein